MKTKSFFMSIIFSFVLLILGYTYVQAGVNAPNNLTATAVSSSQINLSWQDNSKNEKGFKVERATSSSGPWTQIATVGANITTYSNTGLTPSTTYYYRVCAYNSPGNSGYSNTASATTQSGGTVPTTPSNLTATAVSPSQINLTWQDNSTNETGFKIERAASSSGPWTQIATVGTGVTSYSNTGLTTSTTYYYRVCAYNSAGNSGYSNTASATTQSGVTVPTAPSNLTATAVSSSQINLTWQDNSNNETGFKVERAASSTGPWTQIATAGANVTSYSNTSLNPSTTYYYRVCAYNSGGNSSYSNTASATTQSGATVPTAPSNLTATTVSSSQINLTWQDNSNNETGFEIWRCSLSVNWENIANVGTNVISFTDTGLSPSITYTYTICAYNASGRSNYSNNASATTQSGGTIPAAPSNLTATAVSSSQINLAWSDNSNNETGFKIERAASSSGPWTQIVTVGANITTYSNTALTPSTTYYYRVCAYNTAGNSSYSNTASTTTQASGTIPNAPSNLTVTAVSSSQINLTWQDNSTNETGFKVEQAASTSGPWTQIVTTGTNVTSYSNTGLPSCTTYYYRICAYNSGGNSGYSNIPSATTNPNPPSNLTATAVSSSQINLTWQDNSTCETGFMVERSTSSSGPWSQIATVGANVTSYSDTGLNPSTTYYYRVGGSGYSNTASATTQAAGEWSRSFGSSGEDRGHSVAVDSNGNVVITGYFMGTVDFGGGPLTSVLASPVLGPSKDVFLAKYSASGTHLWSRQIGANADDQGNSVVVDSNGDVVVTGSCANSVDFGNGNLTSSFGGYDIFVAKYSGVDGSLLWAKRFGGIYDDYGYGVAVDSSDNVIVTGQFMERVNFGGGALYSAGGGDIFVAKFSPSGTYLWSERFGSENTEFGYTIGVDGSGNVLIVGRFVGTVDFGGGPLTSESSTLDIYVAKYSGTNGSHLWSKRFGSTGTDYANGVAVESNGNVIVTGFFEGTVDFGGGTPLVSAGSRDIFVAKYSAAGSHLWSKRFGSTGTDYANGVTVDSNGNMIVTGTFTGTVDFGGGGLTSAGGYDIFLAKYTASGAHVWSENFGGTINQFGKAVAVNGNSNVAVTGYFENIVDFGGGIHTSAGGFDIFLTSLMP